MSSVHLFNGTRRWSLPHNQRSCGSRLNATTAATGACTNVVLLNLVVSNIKNQVSPGPLTNGLSAIVTINSTGVASDSGSIHVCDKSA